MSFTIDETKTANQNYAAFLEAQKDSGYTLGDFSGTAQGDMEMYTDLKIKASQEDIKRSEFMTARDRAFADFETAKAAEKQVLAQEWQNYEDQGYIIPEPQP